MYIIRALGYCRKQIESSKFNSICYCINILEDMYKVIINWCEGYCQIDPKSDFYESLPQYPFVRAYSKEELEAKIYKAIDDLPNNHYGKFAEQTEVIHKYLI